MSRYFNDYLVHHGIKGQKWGVQNGPPYPLKEGSHSAAEKKAAESDTKGWRAPTGNEGFRGSMDAKSKINPNYPEPGYTNNCVNCNMALAMFMNGYNVQAGPGEGMLFEEIGKCFGNSTISKKYKSIHDMANDMELDGDPHHVNYILRVSFNNNAWGHALSVLGNGDVMDPQSGLGKNGSGNTQALLDFAKWLSADEDNGLFMFAKLDPTNPYPDVDYMFDKGYIKRR